MKIRTLFITCAAGIAVAACESMSVFEDAPVDSRFATMSSQFHVAMVASLDELETALRPNFSLTADQAVSQVLPTTAIALQRRSSGTGFSITAGLPTSVAINERVSQSVDGTDTTTSTETRTRTAGQPPAIPDASAGSPSLRDANTGLPVSGSGIGVDPVLRYHNALALYHQVRLLNHTISNAALRYGMRPYVVSVDVNVTPFHREVSADFYARLTAFTAANLRAQSVRLGECSGRKVNVSSADQIPVVVPLFASDNLELAQTSRLVEALQRFSAALGGTIGAVGVGAGLNLTNEQLDAVLGNDINSLQTLGQLNENTVQVRLGAQRQGTSKHALVTRSHRVTMAVLVPNDFLREAVVSGTGHACLEFAVRTGLRNTADGSKVPDGMRQGVSAEIREIVQIGVLPAWLATDRATLNKAVKAVQEGSDYTAFIKVLVDARNRVCSNTEARKDNKEIETECATIHPDPDLLFAQFLWSELAAVAARSPYRSVPFQVAVPRQLTSLFKNKTGIPIQAVDGGEKNRQIVATLPVNGPVDDKRLSAYARLDGKNWLSASKIAYDKNTNALTIAFAKVNFQSVRNPAKAAGQASKAPAPEIDRAKLSSALKIELVQHLPAGLGTNPAGEKVAFTKFDVRSIDRPEKPGAVEGVKVVDGGIKKVVTDSSGVGSLQLVIAKIPKAPAEVVVKNAQTLAVTGAHAKIKDGNITVAKPTTIKITLAQLVPGDTVTVTTNDKSGGAAHTMSLGVTRISEKN
jgi:hypothetical protein